MKKIFISFTISVFGILIIHNDSGAQSLGPSAAEASAQTIGSVSISSPTAASLGKFGDIPVNYFTGIPNIDIPIYTVQAGNLKLPISLSYHASGLKVQEPAGWVGAGWALNAGGVITRTVQGQPDESGTNSGSQTNGHFSHYGYNSYLYSGQQIQDWLGFAEGRKDGQPDLFFFNFNGYSGKFYFRDDRTPVIVPQQDLTIIPFYSGGRSIDSFKVITPNGDQYVFGSTSGGSGAVPIEITNPYSLKNGGQGDPPTSSWFLNKIVSFDGQFSITLTYQSENYGYYTVAMFPIDGVYTNTYAPYAYDLVKNIIQGVRLSQITFPNGSVTFNQGAVRSDLSDNQPFSDQTYSIGANSLGSIQISDGNGYCKKDTLYYSYFSGDNTTLPISLTAGYSVSSDQLRLRLDSLKEVSCNGSASVPPYKFNYFSGQVPRRLSFGIDHLGFSNGVTSNTDLVPTLVINGTTVPGANRDPGPLATIEAGTLQQITYPTGGSTSLVYETNSVYTTTSYQTTAGLANLVAHLYGQGSFTASGGFTSNGNTINASIDNSSDNYSATFSINNSVGTQVYTTTLGNNSTYNTTINLPAGNYTAYLNVNTAATGGMQAVLTQQITVTVTGNTNIGGLRISSITNNDGITNNNVVTSYSYNNAAGRSTAYLYSIPTYAQQIRNDIIKNTGYYTVAGGFQGFVLGANGCPTTNDYYKASGSIRPMSSVQGSPYGYQTVTVSQAGNGYSVYNYYMTNGGFAPQSGDICIRNISTACTSDIPNYPAAPLPFDSKRGELYYVQHFNNAGQILKDEYHYPVYDTVPIVSTPGFMVSPRYVLGAYQLLGTLYSYGTVRKTREQTVQDDFQPGGGFITKTSTVYYGSKYHNQPTRAVTNTSTGDSLINVSVYSNDFRIPSCDAISDCSTEYNASCNSCLTTYNTANQACTSDTCRTRVDTAFLHCNTNARIGYVSCRNTNYMNSNSSFRTCFNSAEGAADANLKPLLQLQDESRVVPIEVTQWKNANLLHADFTKYDYISTPSNLPYPSKTQLVNLQSPSSTFTNAAVSGSTINKDSRYADESTYVFSAGNPSQITLHDGVIDSYIWDYNLSRPIAKVINTTIDQVAYTSFEADGKGGWTFSGTPQNDGTAITGGKSYVLSSGSISKSGLNTANAFVVSYWSKNGTATVNSSTATALFSKNGWSYYEHLVAKGTITVTVSGSVTIDELRLYPSTAQMTTYTYSPLVGMTSQCDVDSRISYYQYDALGRLQVVKDQDGNIIKTIQYHYQGQ